MTNKGKQDSRPEEVDDTNKKKWVNVHMDPELVDKLDEMVRESGSDRAKLVRLLISNEYQNRQNVRKFLATMKKKKVIPS